MNGGVRARWIFPSLLALEAFACSGGSQSLDGTQPRAGASGETPNAGAPSGSGGVTVATGGASVAGASGTSGRSGGAAGSSSGNSNAGSADTTAGGAASGGGGSPGSAGSLDAGANVGGAEEPSTECGRCGAYAASTQTGMVEPAGLDALSGLAMSHTQPNILFAHADHDRPVVFALDLQGQEHARITLEDAPATDIEDIAVGPCGAQSCVYLADIGDNAAMRNEYALLRFVAPVVPENAGTKAMTPAFQRFRFTYEDGSHNAEGLMVSPEGIVYIVTKLAPSAGGRVAATGPSSIYRLPASMSSDSVARATKVVTLPIPVSGELAASAAAAHPCASSFLVRTYDRVYEFTAPTGLDFESAFTVTPRVVATPDEPQSEGVDYRANGLGFVTSGEGMRAPIMQTSCAP